MSELYARPNKAGTHVVCVQLDCDGRFAEIKRAGGTMALSTMEVGSDVVDQRVIHAGEFYLEMLSGFMAAQPDEIWRTSQKRLRYWRRQLRGVQPRPSAARGGGKRAFLTAAELPARIECHNPKCLRVQVMDADVLGLV